MSHSKRTFQRTVVFLEKRRNTVPTNADMIRLTNARRVGDISFTKNNTATEIGEILVRSLPSLAGKDLSGVEFIASYERGHAMNKVATGMQNGEQIMNLFGGSRKKKIFLLLPNAAATTPPLTSPTTQPPATGALSLPPATQSSIHGSSTQPSTSGALSTTPTTQPSIRGSSTQPSSSGAPSTPPTTQPPMFASSLANPATHSPATITPAATHSSSTAPQTQAMLPSTSTIMPTPSRNGDSDDDIVEIQFDLQQDYLSAANTESPETVGAIEENLCPVGAVDLKNGKVPSHKLDRTQEVLLCERELRNDDLHQRLPFFLNLSFDEMCHQGRIDQKLMVLIVLKEGDDIQPVQRFFSLLENAPNLFYWIAKAGSESGKQVLQKFGSNYQETGVFILAPTTSKPHLVERFSGESLRNATLHEVNDVLTQGTTSLQGLRNEWERVQIRAEQELELEQSLASDKQKERTCTPSISADDSNEDYDVVALRIRQERKKRVGSPPAGEKYNKIILRHSNKKTGRRFRPDALFQEVYDWAGSLDDLPLHFTIHRRQQVVLHSDPLQGHEVLDVREGEQDEIRSILQTEVSFRGNLPPVGVNEQALSDTVADSPQGKIPEEAKETEDEREENEKVEEINKEKDQFEKTVEEYEKGQENEQEKTKEEMDGTAENEQGQEKENQKRRKEETVEARESTKRKKEKNKKTTTKRKKEEEDVKELLPVQGSFRGSIPQAEEQSSSVTVVDETQREKSKKKQKIKEGTQESRKEKHASRDTKRSKVKASKKAMKKSKKMKNPVNQEDDCLQENKEAKGDEDAQEQVEDETDGKEDEQQAERTNVRKRKKDKRTGSQRKKNKKEK